MLFYLERRRKLKVKNFHFYYTCHMIDISGKLLEDLTWLKSILLKKVYDGDDHKLKSLQELSTYKEKRMLTSLIMSLTTHVLWYIWLLISKLFSYGK